MSLFKKVSGAFTGAVVSASNNVVKGATIKKAQIELQDINNRYDECYIIIGKRIADFLRNGETIDDAKVNEAFTRILKFDKKKSELEETIKCLSEEQDALSDAETLIDIEKEVEQKIENYKSLLNNGIYSQEEYDLKVAVLQNRVNNYKLLDSLDKALAGGLISEAEYSQKKADILSRQITS